jgi:broad specificity phosphatase PhoE
MTDPSGPKKQNVHQSRIKPPVLILVRHGQTDYNLQRRFQGHRDIALNAEGRAQAARAGAFVQALCRHEPGARGLIASHVLSSNLSRAIESADHIIAHLPVKPAVTHLAELREFHVGICEGLTFSEFESLHPALAAEYLAQSSANPQTTPWPGGGESAADVAARALRVFDSPSRCYLDDPGPDGRAAHHWSWQDQTIWRGIPCEIWVSHGGLLSVLMDALGVNKDFHIGNSHVIVLGHFRDSVQLLHHAAIS